MVGNCTTGRLGPPNKFIGHLRVFVVSLWHCCLIHFDLRKPTSNPLTPKMLMRSPTIIMACLHAQATYNFSLPCQESLAKAGTLKNTAGIGCRHCHRNSVHRSLTSLEWVLWVGSLPRFPRHLLPSKSDLLRLLVAPKNGDRWRNEKTCRSKPSKQ